MEWRVQIYTHIYLDNSFSTKLQRQFGREKTVFSTNGARKIGCPFTIYKLQYIPHVTQKLTQNG